VRASLSFADECHDSVDGELTAHAAGRAMNNKDMEKVLRHLRRDPVVKAIYDAKSEEIGPNIFRFKAEIGAANVALQ
jgi:ABC-type cobalt transport system substrate-binding protein